MYFLNLTIVCAAHQCCIGPELTILFLNLNADTKVRLCQGRDYRLRSAAEPTLTGDSFMLSTQRRYSIQGGHCVSTDHCPPSLDICTSTHRACSGCMSSPCLEPPVVGGFPCCWRPEQVSFLRGPLELSYDGLHVADQETFQSSKGWLLSTNTF